MLQAKHSFIKVINYDTTNNEWTSFFDNFKREIKSFEITDEIKDAFNKLDGIGIDALSSCKDFEALAKSLGITNKEVIAFVKNTSPAEISLDNFSAKMQKSVQSSSKLGSTLKTIGATLLSTFANMAVMWAVTKGIELAITAIDNYIHRTERLIEAGEQAKQVISDTFDSFQNTKTSTIELGVSLSPENANVDSAKSAIEAIAEKYSKLKNGVNEFTNENETLSIDEYQEYLDVCNQIADQFPSLVSGYDTQGNAILNLGDKASNAANEMMRLYDASMLSANVEIGQNLQSLYDGIEAQVSQYEDLISELDESNSSLEDTLSNIYKEQDKSLEKMFGYGESVVTIPNYNADKDKKFRELLASYNLPISHDFQESNGTDWSFVVSGLDELEQSQIDQLNELWADMNEATLSSIEAEVKSQIAQNNSSKTANELLKQDQWKSLTASLSKYLQTADSFAELDSSIQNAILNALSNVDLNVLTEKYDGKVLPFIYSEFIEPFSTLTPQAQEAISQMFALPDDLNSADYVNTIMSLSKKAFDNVSDAVDFRVKLGLTYIDENGKEVFDVQDKADAIIEQLSGNDETRAISGITRAEITHELSAEDMAIAYDLVVNDEFTGTFDELLAKIAEVKNALEDTETQEAVSGTFASIMADTTENNLSDKVDAFQENISSISDAMAKLKSGDMTSSDIADLTQLFPELAGQTDNLEKALNSLQISQYKNIVQDINDTIANKNITDPKELKSFENFKKELLKSLDLSDADIGADKLRQQIEELYDISSRPTDEQKEILNSFANEFQKELQTEEGRTILYKLSLDPTAATWTAEQWREKYEELKVTVGLQFSNDAIEELDAEYERLQSRDSELQYNIDFKNASGKEITAKDYQDLLDNISAEKANLESKRAELVGEQALVGDNETAYNELQSQIQGVDESLRSLTLSQLEYEEAIRNIPVDKLGNQLEDLQTTASELENSISFKESNGIQLLASDYEALIANSKEQVEILKDQNSEWSASQLGMDKSSDKYRELQAQIDSNNEAIRNAEQSQIEWNNAIKNIPSQALQNLNLLLSAMSEQASNGFISKDTVVALTEANAEYAEVLINTAAGMTIDTQKANELAKVHGQMQEELAGAQKVLAKSKYDKNAKELKRLTRNEGELNRILAERPDGDEYARILALADENAQLQNQIDYWDNLTSEIRGATSMIAMYKAALNSSNPSDNYNTVTSGKEGADKLYEQGWTGKDDFQSYALLIAKDGSTIEDAVLNYEENSKRMERYLTEDTSGLYNFLDDAVDKSAELGNNFVTAGENGRYAFNISSMKDFADSMGISTELAEHFMLALKDAGFEVDLSVIGDGFAESFEEIDYTANNAAKQVQNMFDKMKLLSDSEVDVSGSAESAAESIKKLSESGVDDTVISSLLAQLNEIGAMNGFHVNADFTVSYASVSNAVNMIEQAQQNLEALNQSEGKINVDSSEAEAAKQQVSETVEYLSTLDSEELISLGFKVNGEEGLSEEEILKQLPSIKIPAEIVASSKNESSEENTQITIEANDEPYRNTIDDDVEYAKNQSPEINVGANTDKAISKVKSFVSYVEGLHPNISPTVDTNPLITGIHNALALSTFRINVAASVTGLPSGRNSSGSGNGFVLGTAHASGTVFMDAWNGYRASIGAYAYGNDWALPHDEDALVNETGKPESIVRNGKWFMIPGKAHVESLKRGDIVFSAAQTEELLRTGRVISGGGHGRVALADGTAHNMINAYYDSSLTGGGTSITKRPGQPIGSGTYKNASQAAQAAANAAASAQKSAEKTDELYDHIVDQQERIQARIDQLTTSAENAITYQQGNAYYQKAIDSLSDLILTNEAGYDRYIAQANAVGLSEDIAALIRDGAIDIKAYDEKTQNLISDYKEWYEKALECERSIQELRIQQGELAKAQLDNIVDKYAQVTDLLQSKKDLVAAYDGYTTQIGASDTSIYRKNIYEKQRDYETASMNKMIEARDAYINDLNKQMQLDLIKKGSDAWYEAQAQIEEFNISIMNSREEIESFDEKLRNMKITGLQIVIDTASRWISKLSSVISLQEARGVTVTEKQYNMQIGANNDKIVRLYAQKQQYEQNQTYYNTNSEKFQELADKIAQCDEEILQLATDNESLKDAIREARWKAFDDLQSATDNTISSIEHMRSLLSDVKVDNDGSLLASAYAEIELIGQGMVQSRKKVEDYKTALAKLEQELRNGNITQAEYTEQSREFIGVIQDSVSNIENYKNALVDMYKEQQEKANDALQDEIALRQDALKKKKEYWDYNKSISSKNRDINAIKAQIAALEGVSSAAGQAKLKSLQADLAEAQEDLDDTVREHEYELRITGYDELADDAQKALDESLHILETSAEAQQIVVNNMLDQIKSNYKTAYSEINSVLNSTGTVLDAQLQKMIDFQKRAAEANKAVETAKNASNDSTNKSATKNTVSSSETANNVKTSAINTQTASTKKAETSASTGSGTNGTAKRDTQTKVNADTGSTSTTKISTAKKVQSIKLDRAKASIFVGKTVTIKAVIQPSDATASLTWTSSDPSIATVSNGKVKGIKIGIVTITCVDAATKKSAKCIVTVTAPAAISANRGWVKDAVGNWKYYNNDGSYVKSDWKEVNGKWYSFDGKGNMQNGWQKIDDKWYYMQSDGAMLANDWIQTNGKWYYLTPSGHMATNAYVKARDNSGLYYWVNEDGVWEPVWNTKTPDLTKYNAYAKGTNSAKPGWAQVYEDGYEMIYTRDGNVYRDLSAGDVVFSNSQTQLLYELSKNPAKFMAAMHIPTNMGLNTSVPNIENKQNYSDNSVTNVTVSFDHFVDRIDKLDYNTAKTLSDQLGPFISESLRKELGKTGVKKTFGR